MPKPGPDPNWDAASRVIREAAKLAGDGWRIKRSRLPRESARRAKLFANAQRTLETMARIGGSRFAYTYVAGNTRSGLPWGLGIHIDDDHDMMWSPRDGFRRVEFDPLPF